MIKKALASVSALAIAAGFSLLVIGLVSVYIHATGIADNLDALVEAQPVGICPDDEPVPAGHRCKQGFRRPQAKTAFDELCRINELQCINITDEWPSQ